MRKKIILIIASFFVLLLILRLPQIIKFSPVMLQLMFNREIQLKKEDHNINILLMGVAGGDHEGPDLTDTIMFASLDIEKKRVTFISIPRDLWIPDLKGKINTAYAVGESKKKGGGLILAKAVVSKILNQPVDYGFVIDFDGFVKAVDLIGGLDITVDRAFDDYQYPDEKNKEDLCGHSLQEATAQIATMSATEVFPCRYIQVHFDKGLQYMDGKNSLIFVRSRYSIGPEGTDFARSRRQQKVIKAFKDKVMSLGILLNPLKVDGLYTLLSKSIDTDIKTSEIDDFIRLANQMREAKIHSTVIDAAIGYKEEKEKKALLINPSVANYNGAWVLIPRLGDQNFTEVQEFASCSLKSENCKIK